MYISRWFPIPKIIEMRYASIHISSDNHIMYMECRRKHNALLPKVFEKISFARTDDNDSADLILKLRSLRNKYKTEFIKATIPESKSYLFEAEIPRVADSDLYEAVAFIIEEKAPVTLSDIIFGFRIIDYSDPNKFTVSVSVVPRDVVNFYIDIFNTVGFIPVTFKVEVQAVVNAVVPIGNKTSVIIVSMKKNKMIISIVYNEGVLFATTVDVGGGIFDDVLVANYPNSTLEEIEKLKFTEDFISNKRDGAVQTGFLAHADRVREQINKYYIYSQTHKAAGAPTESEPAKVIFIGKEACIPGLVDYLRSVLKIPVEQGDVWANLFNISNHMPDLTKPESYDFVETSGLLVDRD